MDSIIVLDTEATGIPNWKEPSGHKTQPHIVQLAAVQVDIATADIIQSMDVIIKPDGWVSEPEALEVHGITHEHAMDVGIPEDLVVDMFLAMWNGRKRVMFNTTYDNRIIRIATKRFCSQQVADNWHEGKQGEEWECMMLAARKVMGGKQPKLTAAYEHFMGKPLEGAHNAMVDTLACKDIWFAIKGLIGKAPSDFSLNTDGDGQDFNVPI
ncbi:MAG TPA: 3'-5' exonuclease [Gammaproteobacteria bacterium]|nr:3'-5' exonuclease [Gammaproteobacteria bacterium]